MAHDPRTPVAVRYLVYGGIAFTLIPDDWLPDWFPGLGLVDEAAVLPGVVAVSMMLIPQEVKEDHDAEAEKAIERDKKAGPSHAPTPKTVGIA